ncbi:sensor histidine kinase [Bacillus sp. SCS-151]|uniref:sensor histidine kinase n=1 Tax=Nanhaiella sioensis TaxID=3115293 RepID=UPI00397AA105
MITGIKRRIVIHYTLVILLTVALFEGIFIGIIHFYYYDGIEKSLINHAEISASLANRQMNITKQNLDQNLSIIRDNLIHEGADLQVINEEGRVLTTSSGFGIESLIKTKDVQEALRGKTISWYMNNDVANERLLAVSTPLIDEGEPYAVIRYITSLEEVDRTVQNIYWISISIGAVVMIATFLISYTLANSIAKPIYELTGATKKIAKGNFESRIEESYIDEIGTLAKTFNYMAEELTKNDKMKNEFISSVSHEIRTPLTSIKGWSETMLSGDLANKEETTLGLSIIQKETDRLIGLVEDLLDFSAYNRDSIRLNLSTTDLSSLINDVTSQMKAKASNKHISIIFDTSDTQVLSEIDPNRMKQVLINLLDNAIKYSPQNSSITITCTETNDNVIVTVMDEGNGIEEEEISNITKMFYQTNAHKEGTGLGLAISQKIIDLHHGTLNIQSKINEGTTITVTIPKKK